MGIIEAIIDAVHKDTYQKQHELVEKIQATHASDAPNNYVFGIIHLGVVITTTTDRRWIAYIHQNPQKLSSLVTEMANRYLSNQTEIANSVRKMEQLLGVAYKVFCKESDEALLNNIPPAIARRIMQGRPETPPQQLYSLVKDRHPFWEQYKQYVVDYSHKLFGSELL